MRLIWCLLFILRNTERINSAFTEDSACGVTKGCFSDCSGGSGCTYLISWSSGETAVTFTIKVELGSNANQYGAFGLSSSQNMRDASVTSCIMTNSGSTFNYQNSYNAASGYSNSPVSNPTDGLSSLSGSYNSGILTCTFDRTLTNSDPQVFNLNNEYYILYAKGSGGITQHSSGDRAVSTVKVNLQNITTTGGASDELTKIKAHGGLAIMAWMCFINIGYIIARYYKPLFPTKKILGADVWFLIHRVLMVVGAVMTITSFGVIIHGHFNVGENNWEKSHPYLGVLVLCFVIINPILGILRPDKDSKYRPLFYWFHYCIGVGVLILALINIFIGIRLEKAATSDKAYYVFIAYEVFQIALIVVLEILKYIGSTKTPTVKSDLEMKPVSQPDKSSTTVTSGSENPPYAWTLKLVLLAIHIVITVALSSAITGIVATTTSSSD